MGISPDVVMHVRQPSFQGAEEDGDDIARREGRPELEPQRVKWVHRCHPEGGKELWRISREWSSYSGYRYWSSLLFRDWIQRLDWREDTGREDSEEVEPSTRLAAWRGGGEHVAKAQGEWSLAPSEWGRSSR